MIDVANWLSLLGSISTMTLATTDLQGHPHATPVYFVHNDEMHLYFFSDENSLHCQHIVKNSKAAAAIYPECRGWRDIKGLQLRGEVRFVAANSEWDAAWGQYQKKFPFVRSMKAVIAQNKLYVFTPTWIRGIDNSQGFGFKKEWDLL
jgi:uncharacterized protein YhbP (UPF0306 family)